jgi:hypothetical protein
VTSLQLQERGFAVFDRVAAERNSRIEIADVLQLISGA